MFSFTEWCLVNQGQYYIYPYLTYRKFYWVWKPQLFDSKIPGQKMHVFFFFFSWLYLFVKCRSQCPRGLRRRSAAARLLRLWVRIPPGSWMSVCCECCVLSGGGLCDELITRPEESYRLWCVVCDSETSWMWRPWPTGGCRAKNKRTFIC